MSKKLLLLHSGDGEAAEVGELAAAIGLLGSTAIVGNLASGDYDALLDAVVEADTVVFWPRTNPLAS